MLQVVEPAPPAPQPVPPTPAPPREPTTPPLPAPLLHATPPAPRPRAATRWKGVPWRERGLKVFTASPAYGIALVVHAIVLLGLSLWTIAVLLPPTPSAVGVRLVKTEEIRSGDPAPRTQELSALMEAPELPQEEASDAPALDASLGGTAGAALVDAPVPFGLLSGPQGGPGQASGQGKGRPGGGGRAGASRASDGARDAALEWLVRHRTRQGAWGVVRQEEDDHEGLDEPQVAHTALGLLCFLCAGHAPGKDGPYRHVVEAAEGWLIAQVEQDGVFRSSRREWERHYHQAIGTLALAEALQRRRTRPLEEAVTRSVAYLERVRGRWGWRYAARQDGDTSVNGWVVLALKSAEHAQVRVSPESYEVVRRYLDRVTREDGATGYTSAQDVKDSMTATGLFLRIMLGEPPTTRRNAAAARLVSRMRRFDVPDFGLYGIYYAALAMYQVGGPLWADFNPHVRDRLVRAMHDGRGCEQGSWRPMGWTSDLLLSTTFATLTLQTYYRYLPVHGGIEEQGAVASAQAEEEAGTPALSEGELALDEAAQALLAARRDRDPGGLLAAEAAYERAAALLARQDPELAAEARARLVEVAELGRDPRRALERAEAYLEALPRGSAPDPAVLRVRRRERYRALVEAVEALNGLPEATRGERARALAGQAKALRAAVGAEPLRAGQDEEREERTRMLEALGELEGALLLMGEDDASVETALRELERQRPTGSPSDFEVRALGALLRRAGRAYEVAARADQGAWEAGEKDLARYEARRPDERLTVEDAAALGPLRERVSLLRVAALLGLGRDAEALAALAALEATWPPETHRAYRAALERTALARRVEAGQASPAERARFEALLRAWSRENPQLRPAERVALGQRLLDLGDLSEAARQLELAAARPGELQPAQLRQAHLGLARARRLQGDPAQALAALEALPPAAQRDVAVRLERNLSLRATGEHQAAIEDYQRLVRALAEGRPEDWWQVVEELGRTLSEAGRVDEARRHLEGLRQLDPTFGGDLRRAERLLQLMHELDSAR